MTSASRQPNDRTYGAKLIALFAKLLFTGRAYSLPELARELECSKQTVMRLVNDISTSYAVDIAEEMRGRRKYYWINRAERVEPAALLSESEHRKLQMCRAFTEHLLGADMYHEVERAIEKSAMQLPPGVEPGEAAFGIVRSGTIDYTAHEDVLRTLMEGMDQRRVVEVVYRKLGGAAPKTFRIKPLKVFAHRESVYVHARYAQKPGEPRKTITYDPMLAVQRIEQATLTDQAFRRPPDYDFEKAMNQGFGVWAQKKFRVVLELSGWAADYARERTWSPEQTIEEISEGKIRLGFWATSEPEVLGLVLSFGGACCVLQPDSLISAIIMSAQAILSQQDRNA